MDAAGACLFIHSYRFGRREVRSISY
uniref:Uncharacterized protein n=1 Tax=Zea mays TaxID=4577 RepID=B4FDQ3_MAIZE|nr:unknown [Zea mays]ACR37064.1 unknown [Zea mays]